VHPENIALCKRAARLVGLDVAGVDYISEDIGRPWYEAGGIVVEVNAQPQIGYSAALELLSACCKNVTPSPIYLLVYRTLGDVNVDTIRQLIHELDLYVGIFAGRRIYRDTVQRNALVSDYDAIVSAVEDREVSSALLVISYEELIKHGLPIDKMEGLVVYNFTSSWDQAALEHLNLISELYDIKIIKK
jgi:cyanophycin synthetase